MIVYVEPLVANYENGLSAHVGCLPYWNNGYSRLGDHVAPGVHAVYQLLDRQWQSVASLTFICGNLAERTEIKSIIAIVNGQPIYLPNEHGITDLIMSQFVADAAEHYRLAELNISKQRKGE